MSDDEIERCLQHYRVPTDRPLVVQVSRFDRWKDPVGAIEAFRNAAEQVDGRLVLVGNSVDAPESGVILETIHSSLDDRMIVLTVDDSNLVNALQRRAAVVLQKSVREGFGLTVIEANVERSRGHRWQCGRHSPADQGWRKWISGRYD